MEFVLAGYDQVASSGPPDWVPDENYSDHDSALAQARAHLISFPDSRIDITQIDGDRRQVVTVVTTNYIDYRVRPHEPAAEPSTTSPSGRVPVVAEPERMPTVEERAPRPITSHLVRRDRAGQKAPESRAKPGKTRQNKVVEVRRRWRSTEISTSESPPQVRLRLERLSGLEIAWQPTGQPLVPPIRFRCERFKTVRVPRFRTTRRIGAIANGRIDPRSGGATVLLLFQPTLGVIALISTLGITGAAFIWTSLSVDTGKDDRIAWAVFAAILGVLAIELCWELWGVRRYRRLIDAELLVACSGQTFQPDQKSGQQP